MVVGDITNKIKEDLRSLSYGGGVYMLSYPAYYDDGSAVTVAVKLEHETDVVLERGEEAENMALLSTSDEYTIMDLGSVAERFSNIDDIDRIITSACAKYHVQYDGEFISLGADVDTTNTKLNRYLKCIFEIEREALKQAVVTPAPESSQESDVSKKFMEYITNKTE